VAVHNSIRAAVRLWYKAQGVSHGVESRNGRGWLILTPTPQVRPAQQFSPAGLVESQISPSSMHASTDLDVAKAAKAATTVRTNEKCMSCAR
jgi:hypothetical protein